MSLKNHAVWDEKQILKHGSASGCGTTNVWNKVTALVDWNQEGATVAVLFVAWLVSGSSWSDCCYFWVRHFGCTPNITCLSWPCQASADSCRFLRVAVYFHEYSRSYPTNGGRADRELKLHFRAYRQRTVYGRHPCCKVRRRRKPVAGRDSTQDSTRTQR